MPSNRSKSKKDHEEEQKEDEFCSLATVKALINEALASQAKRHDAIVKTLTEKIESQAILIQDLKTSLEYSQKEIVEMKTDSVIYKKEHQENITKLDNLSKDETALRNKVTYLENQSRRNNLRVNGIREDPNETWDDTEAKLKKIISESLQLGYEPDIERAHRVGPFANKDGTPLRRPRTIVCKFYDWKVKEEILRQARRLKPKYVYYSEDLADVTVQNRKDQLDKLKEAKKAGKTAYFVLDKLIIKDKPKK